jgi:recombination protein RecA
VGLQARLMSQALRKLTALLAKSNTCAIFINQIREKIGVMFGNPEVTPGGRALKFYASMRLDIRRVESIKSGEVNVGNKVKVKVVKNKTAQPFREGFFDIIFGEGISKEGALIDKAVDMEIIDKSGTWLSFGENKIGQGRDAAKTFLKEHPEIMAQIERKVLEKAGLIAPETKAATPAAGSTHPTGSTSSPHASSGQAGSPQVKKDPEKLKVLLKK